ncbi:MAG: hypothetical protein GQ537_06815 [Gammaproteobacteria bacterium]|nr:hypothetical protein [Gammaproteobacteria bacterium]
MGKPTHTLLLLLLTLALAIAPLRGAWAIAEMPVVEVESHCAQLDMQHQDSGSGSTHDCKQGCDSACCDDSCNSCVHVTSAISNTLVLAPAVTGPPLTLNIPASFTARTIIPLLRPPSSL